MFYDFSEFGAYLVNFEQAGYLLNMTTIILIIVSIAIAISCSLTETILMMSAISVLISLCYLLMDAPDVAMTEVALGSCLSTCVLLNFIKILKISKSDVVSYNKIVPALVVCVLFISSLVFVNLDLPEYGNESNLHRHISKYYIENTKYEVGTKSLVTGLLASYRGYDTLGETAVILIAGLAVLLILSTKIYEKKPE